MSVLARFYIAEIKHTAYGHNIPGQTAPDPNAHGVVVLQAVSRGEENKQWAKWTPSGRLEMTINGPALGWFHDNLGKDVLLTIQLANDE